ncbi:high mobility group box domain-containing protein [Cyathus striatus]|nr:high mobility group box domain-containing protein [Cyathus striatus]
MNAFLIFARRRRRELGSIHGNLRTGQISKILAKEWKSMSKKQKRVYSRKAKKLQELHKARYPDYKYTRSPNNTRKKKKAKMPLSPNEGDIYLQQHGSDQHGSQQHATRNEFEAFQSLKGLDYYNNHRSMITGSDLFNFEHGFAAFQPSLPGYSQNANFSDVFCTQSQTYYHHSTAISQLNNLIQNPIQNALLGFAPQDDLFLPPKEPTPEDDDSEQQP